MILNLTQHILHIGQRVGQIVGGGVGLGVVLIAISLFVKKKAE